jgi:hypothetical protein
MNEIQATQADRLKQLHGEIMGAARMVLDKAIEAGGILHDVKAALPHGDFIEWVETNAGFNIRTAQRYMKIHENREQIKNDNVTLLMDAHKMLTAPKDERLSDAEQSEFERLEGIIEAGFSALRAAGLSLDDALRMAEWDAKFAVHHKKIVALKEEWGTLKDSDSLAAVADFYHRAKDASFEAGSITLEAEIYLGRALNELERDHPEAYQQMMRKGGSLD